jgi:hypothetical protein
VLLPATLRMQPLLEGQRLGDGDDHGLPPRDGRGR